MMPTNDTGPASDTAAPVASDALTSAIRSVRSTSTPRAAADSLPTLMQIEHARQRREARPRDRHRHQRRDDGRVGGDVERSHQPAHVAERLGEVRQVLHERDHRRQQRGAP